MGSSSTATLWAEMLDREAAVAEVREMLEREQQAAAEQEEESGQHLQEMLERERQAAAAQDNHHQQGGPSGGSSSGAGAPRPVDPSSGEGSESHRVAEHVGADSLHITLIMMVVNHIVRYPPPGFPRNGFWVWDLKKAVHYLDVAPEGYRTVGPMTGRGRKLPGFAFRELELWILSSTSKEDNRWMQLFLEGMSCLSPQLATDAYHTR